MDESIEILDWLACLTVDRALGDPSLSAIEELFRVTIGRGMLGYALAEWGRVGPEWARVGPCRTGGFPNAIERRVLVAWLAHLEQHGCMDEAPEEALSWRERGRHLRFADKVEIDPYRIEG